MGTLWGLIFQRVPFSFKQKRIDRVRNYGYGNIQVDFDRDEALNKLLWDTFSEKT